jgi:cytoskeletal protein CcmA (bactofilin family)
VAGALVSVRGAVGDELRAAGAEVDVDVTTKGDAKVAGAIVSIKGGVEKDLYVAGARVNVDARIGGSLKAAGARVLIGSQSNVEGAMRLAGADVVFAGTSRGSAEIYGDTVQIDGRIGSDLLVRARSVTIGKTAVVEGDAIFQTLDEPQIEEGATLRGRQTFTSPQPSPRAAWSIVKALFATLLFGIGAGYPWADFAGDRTLLCRTSHISGPRGAPSQRAFRACCRDSGAALCCNPHGDGHRHSAQPIDPPRVPADVVRRMGGCRVRRRGLDP